MSDVTLSLLVKLSTITLILFLFIFAYFPIIRIYLLESLAHKYSKLHSRSVRLLSNRTWESNVSTSIKDDFPAKDSNTFKYISFIPIIYHSIVYNKRNKTSNNPYLKEHEYIFANLNDKDSKVITNLYKNKLNLESQAAIINSPFWWPLILPLTVLFVLLPSLKKKIILFFKPGLYHSSASSIKLHNLLHKSN